MIISTNFLREIFLVLVAVLHIYFLVLEMFLWTKPMGLKVFRQTLEQAASSKTLAANQGLYNGFLAAGLIWAAVYPQITVSIPLGIFFFSCVVIAGIYGAATVSRKIFFVQALPGIIGLALSLFM